MKHYLLDMSSLAAYLQSKEPAVQMIQPLIESHEVATSIIVYAEVMEYIQGLPRLPIASMSCNKCYEKSILTSLPTRF
jgi:hypothetical protein